ncbi:competence protein CoiA family protein [uncultured Psychrobacter sp.]|uniref:competence protein CoiA n=1 Tax=uncultured Psychrobacter sp. TaxID=259303 RepID=UPI0026137F1C|nr:competence protein CoiA family protein [uncultured Psychrobacter sp.]
MAFSCKKNNQTIYSFQYDLKDWIALKEDKNAAFTMSCCGKQAILKTSKLGTQFFAHKVKPDNSSCSTGGESDEHMDIKRLVMQELARNGWSVEVEKRGATPSGEEWIADIYAEKGKAKIAIEVQWSPQTFIETRRRQEKYAQSGVRCAWLLRSGSVKDTNAITGDYAYSTKDLPVFSIYRNKRQIDKTYMIYNVNELDNNSDRYNYRSFKPIALSLDYFIKSLVSQGIKFVPCERFTSIKFRIKHKPVVEVSLGLSKQFCTKCGHTNKIVARVSFKERYKTRFKKIKDCSSKEIEFINTYFARKYAFSPIKQVRSVILNKGFIVNSCIKCGFVIDRDGSHSSYSYEINTKSIFIRHQGLDIEQVYATDTAINVECVYQVNNNLKIKYNEGFEFGKWVIRDM